MEIVSDVQCFSYVELPTRDLIGLESDDSDRMTGYTEVIHFLKDLLHLNVKPSTVYSWETPHQIRARFAKSMLQH
jgi:hypothetical protein